ncbi:putative leucine-rich repeat domain superfamily [Helianthus debilis subsp. tardiflorus]
MLGASTCGGVVTKQPTFYFPLSLHLLKDCNLECFSSGFKIQSYLQYLNLGNNLFEFISCYNHLKSLRVLDLSFCSRLKCLVCLPRTLAELYIYILLCVTRENNFQIT